jgi:hypothetical protein
MPGSRDRRRSSAFASETTRRPWLRGARAGRRSCCCTHSGSTGTCGSRSWSVSRSGGASTPTTCAAMAEPRARRPRSRWTTSPPTSLPRSTPSSSSRRTSSALLRRRRRPDGRGPRPGTIRLAGAAGHHRLSLRRLRGPGALGRNRRHGGAGRPEPDPLVHARGPRRQRLERAPRALARPARRPARLGSRLAIVREPRRRGSPRLAARADARPRRRARCVDDARDHAGNRRAHSGLDLPRAARDSAHADPQQAEPRRGCPRTSSYRSTSSATDGARNESVRLAPVSAYPRGDCLARRSRHAQPAGDTSKRAPRSGLSGPPRRARTTKHCASSAAGRGGCARS